MVPRGRDSVTGGSRETGGAPAVGEPALRDSAAGESAAGESAAGESAGSSAVGQAARGRVVCVQGPTASGKSELAEEIALAIGGEIVSADSMQVYRGMDIGTAKVPELERRVPYHCLDLADVGEPYSAALYQRDSRAAFSEIWGRGRTPVLCGGTGLYVDAALSELSFPAGEQAGNPVREKWERIASEQGVEYVHGELERLDPKSAALIHPNNVRRVIRALEMCEEGESYAERKSRFREVGEWCPSVRIALRLDREVLYRRIGERVDEMFERGLEEEVRGLLERGLAESVTASQAIGYKEVARAIRGECTIDEAREAVKQATRRYAKRQMSWLSGERNIVWIDADDGITGEVVSRALEAIGR